MINSRITNNSGSSNGGPGVIDRFGDTTITNSSFESNTAGGFAFTAPVTDTETGIIYNPCLQRPTHNPHPHLT